jgi:hypothetical protein
MTVPHLTQAPAIPVALPAQGRASFGQALGSAVSMKWAALQDAGKAVALLAGLEPEITPAQMRNFPALLREVGQRRREVAERGIEDLAAIMEPGLAALLAVNARGADAKAPALALWREYCAARQALMALLPEAGALGPKRTA